MRSSAQENGERGAISVVFLLILIFVLVPMTGLAIDATILFVVKAKLVAAVDAAALAAGRSLSVGLDLQSQETAAVDTANNYFKANFPDRYWNATATVQVTPAESERVRTISVQAQATVPLLFMPALGVPQAVVAAAGQSSRRDLNIIMVLDRSGSMADSGSCGPMKAAAQEFVDLWSNGRDTLGLVTFMQSANVDYAPSNQFQTSSPTLKSVIGNIVCTSSTASADALHLAYQQIKAINQPGALNVVVFFTDGLPNGVRANYPIVSTSKCLATSIEGSIAEGSPSSGIFDVTGVPDSKGPKGLVQISGCAYLKNSNRVDQDVAFIPDQDVWGNSTFGYRSVTTYSDQSKPSYNHIRVDDPNNIDSASRNAADSQAHTIRTDSTFQPIIETIGYSTAIDKTFLLRVSNDPSSPIYDPSLPAGKFVYAPDKNSLPTAFRAIASQILRLSQ